MAEQDINNTLRSQFNNISFREIYKTGWLKKIVTSGIKKKKDKFWVVFCVHDDKNAFLEFYIDNKISVLHKPDNYIYLNDIQHISPTICQNEQEYEFALTLKTDCIRLTIEKWEHMLDWITSLQQKLNELNILNPKDNVYTKSPEYRTTTLLTTRDPNSPLPPPPPILPDDLIPGIETIRFESNTPSRNLNRTSSQNDNNQQGASVFNFDNIPDLQATNTEITNCHYERLFNLDSDPGPSNRQINNLQQPPQSYKTFREQQVLQLQKEMQHYSGLKLQLRKKDCLNSIAFVDAFNSVWVCGWKQKELACLYNALHIGDKVISISGIKIKSSNEAYQLLQSNYCGIYVDLIIKRIPHGQIFLLHREQEGQSLGIIQENNTAIIERIEDDSLAYRQGLTTKTKTCDGLSLTNWVLTEINGRPLNLFFKKNQIKDRLNSVGRDISILVQPLDLIRQLKKELKTIKNYKEYLLQ